jgi:3-deoxy-D-manno-octulosonic-acid transferase
MLGLLFDIAYGLGLLLASPIWLFRMLRHGKYRRDWSVRLGGVPRRYGLQPLIWIYGVSVGEINAARSLVNELHAQLPDYRIAVSSATDTGLSAAQKAFAPDHQVFRWPADFSLAVWRALNRLRPALVVLMEGDVWPNFVRTCRRRGIPVIVVNGRIGPKKGFPRYMKVRPLAAWLFNSLWAIGVQHELYAELFGKLGVHQSKLVLTGMMKFDSCEIADQVKGQEALAAALGIDARRKLLVAGGTGAGEEPQVLGAYRELLRQGHWQDGQPQLVIVPRKPERFEEVARTIADAGFAVVRRSRHPDGSPAPADGDAVILGDTMGDLRKLYALSFAGFIGRSLVSEGGSDMIEAAALAKPVAFGPYTFNFPQADSMVQAGCARRVADARELSAAWRQWLEDPAGAQAVGRKAQQWVKAQQGATRRNVELICRFLNRHPALAPGGIATDVIAQQ